MNLANKLTLLRVIMIPAFLGVLYWGGPNSEYIALAIFVIASLTDFLDGYIARSRGLVTDFGKFMDPLADKILVAAALLALVEPCSGLSRRGSCPPGRWPLSSFGSLPSRASA